MREHPILFSAQMVRAILEDRKTQTRRVVKPQPPAGTAQVSTWHHPDPRPHFFASANGEFLDGWCVPCPYGQPGDRLWVRESCRGEELDSGLDGVRYRADDAFIPIQNTSAASIEWLKLHTYRGHHGAPAGPWVPSIHMPRWASRILLEITAVRVERLNDISQADAIAEGAPPSHPSIDRISQEFGQPDFPRSWYAQLWEQINGPGSWAANPFVWVVGFRRVKP